MKKFLKLLMFIIAFCIVMFVVIFYGNRQNSVYTRTFDISNDEIKEVSHLRIGTYNIKSLNMGEGLAAFQKEMEELSLDIVALQEVDSKAQRSGNIDMVKEMGKASGYPYVYFYPSMWIIDGYYGLGILSRYPIEIVSSVQLPNVYWKEPRILAYAGIRVGEELLHIYNTHLTYDDRNVRNNQIAYLQDHLANREKTILLGDFNTFLANVDFTIEGMHQLNTEPKLLTFRDIASPDNIYYTNDFHVENLSVSESRFSDHDVLYCDISW